MKYINKILFILLSFFMITSYTYANSDLVNIYFFHSYTCKHCQKEKELLTKLEEDNKNIKVYMYEISEEDNSKKLEEISKLLNVKVSGVPFTIIGTKTYNGYSEESSKKNFLGAISYFEEYGYEDVVANYLGIKETGQIKENKDNITLEEYMKNYENYTFDIPLIGKVETKNLTLPLITIVIGLLDGFNPCAMWVLLFLISMLMGMKNKKRMWTLGISFLVASTLTYLLFMIAWLNVASLLSSIIYFRLIIALVALTGGSINLVSYFKNRKTSGCTVTNDNQRNKVFIKIKKFTTEKNFLLALFGVITLAVSVNIIELACSAGLPIVFIEILNVNNLTIFEQGIYIALYLLCFFLDDLIVFIVAMTTLRLTAVSTKYGKISKLVGGILLVIIGILMIFKPEWLMFNF